MPYKINSTLKVYYANVQSLKNKFNELKLQIIYENYDIIGLTETWINENDFIHEYNIPGYCLFSVHREKRGGGVLLLIKNKLNPVLLQSDKIVNIDSLFVELTTVGNKKLRLGIYYRPPAQSNETDNQIATNIDNNVNTTREVVIMGDFNLPCKVWSEPFSHHTGKILYDFICISELNQMVNFPTRGENILDLVLTTDSELIKNIHVCDKISDHYSIAYEIKTTSKFRTEAIDYIPHFRKANFNKIRLDFIDYKLENILNDMDCKYGWYKLHGVISKLQSLYIPNKINKTIKPQPQWWNSQIKMALKNKCKLFKSFYTSPTDINKIAYDAQRRLVTKLIREAKYNYEAYIAKNSN
jgi:hypothetical protein